MGNIQRTMPIVTIPERKAALLAARTGAVEALLPRLAAEGRELGGRYILFGSAARGTMRPHSDVDLLLDFADWDTTTAAWTFAEENCAALDLPYDIRPLAWCDERFLAHVLPTATVLG